MSTHKPFQFMCPDCWLDNKLVIGMLRDMNDSKTLLVHWSFAPDHVNPLPGTFQGLAVGPEENLKSLPYSSSPYRIGSLPPLSLIHHLPVPLARFLFCEHAEFIPASEPWPLFLPLSRMCFTSSFHGLLLLVQILIKTPIFSGCHP